MFYDLSLGSQAAQAKAQIDDALQAVRPAGNLQAAFPSGQAGPQGALGAAQAGPMSAPVPTMAPAPPPGPGAPASGPSQQAPANVGTGMQAMSQSRGPAFQVAPQKQAPGQAAPPKMFAKGGRVKFAVNAKRAPKATKRKPLRKLAYR